MSCATRSTKSRCFPMHFREHITSRPKKKSDVCFIRVCVFVWACMCVCVSFIGVGVCVSFVHPTLIKVATKEMKMCFYSNVHHLVQMLKLRQKDPQVLAYSGTHNAILHWPKYFLKTWNLIDILTRWGPPYGRPLQQHVFLSSILLPFVLAHHLNESIEGCKRNPMIQEWNATSCEGHACERLTRIGIMGTRGRLWMILKTHCLHSWKGKPSTASIIQVYVCNFHTFWQCSRVHCKVMILSQNTISLAMSLQ